MNMFVRIRLRSSTSQRRPTASFDLAFVFRVRWFLRLLC